MTDRETSCCFTGHRASKLPWGSNEADARCLALKQKIADTVEAVCKSGIRHFICGMASGCDLYFAEAVLALREQHDGITLEAAIPWEGQARDLNGPLRRRYDRIAAECDFQTLVQKPYTPTCMQRRNRYMVDHSAVLIAAYGGAAGGTRSTILYAMRQGLETIEIPV